MSEYLSHQPPIESDTADTYLDENFVSEPTKKQLNDWALRANRDRDDVAFENVYNYFFPRLVTFVFKWIRNNRFPNKDQVAEDIAQDVLLAFWKQRPKFTSIDITSYLFQAAKNRLYNYTRNHQKVDYAVTVSDINKYVDSTLLNPEAHVIFMQDLQQILDAFPQISPINRSIIIDRYIYEKAYRLIAEESTPPISEDAAKQRHKRALDQLKDLLWIPYSRYKRKPK